MMSSEPSNFQKLFNSDRLKVLGSGAFAGVTSRTATAPLERIKIFNQVAGSNSNFGKYGGIITSLNTMIKDEGIKGLFKGNGTNCVKVAPTSGIRFLAFETYKKWLIQPGEQVLPTPKKLLNGALAGMTAQAITFPLDLIRTRLSLQTSEIYYKGIIHAFSRISQEEGVRGLYKGIGAALLSVGPFAAVNFATYESLKEFGNSRLVNPGAFWNGGYGATSGAVAMTALYPLDLLKRNMMIQGKGGEEKMYNNVFEVVKGIWRKEGVKGFYRGILPSYLKVVPTTAITFFSYELCTKYLQVKK